VYYRANQPAHDPFSIFEQFGFGGFGGFGRQNREEPRTPTVNIPLRVTLRQLYVGELLDVNYVRQVLCVEASSCQKNNNECQGPGVKVKVQQLAPGFVQQVQVNFFQFQYIILVFLIFGDTFRSMIRHVLHVENRGNRLVKHVQRE
jgi:hypothetical protein